MKQIIKGNNIYIFDDSEKEINLEIKDNSKVFLSGFKNSNKDTKIKIKGNNIEIYINYVNVIQNSKIETNIVCEMFGDKNRCEIDIKNIMKNKADLTCNAEIIINKNTFGNKGYLNQENIIIGDDTKSKGIPKLMIYSKDIEAGHSMKVEKIKETDLFYLQSRGLTNDISINMLLKSHINNAYECFFKLKDEDINRLIDIEYGKL